MWKFWWVLYAALAASYFLGGPDIFDGLYIRGAVPAALGATTAILFSFYYSLIRSQERSKVDNQYLDVTQKSNSKIFLICVGGVLFANLFLILESPSAIQRNQFLLAGGVAASQYGLALLSQQSD